jgi:hypothetical protein
MSRWHDMVDWIGGWPFEVAKPEQIFEFLKRRGFLLLTMTTSRGGLGCNEFVFLRRPCNLKTLESLGEDCELPKTIASDKRSVLSSTVN